MKITDVQLDEVKMSPTALMQFMSSPEAKGIMVGFEAEMCVPNFRGEGYDDEQEPDYDQDERIPSGLDMRDLQDWFSETHGRREPIWDRIESDYMDWASDKESEWVDERREDRALELAREQYDEEEGVRKFAQNDDMSEDEIDNMVDAYNKAPRFTKSSDQQAYEEQHPLYKKYLQYAESAEEMMLDSMEDYLDQAEEELREEFWGSEAPTLGEFFHSQGYRYYQAVSDEYGLTWPYWSSNEEDRGVFDVDAVKDRIAPVITDLTGFPVKVSSGYHSQPRGNYYIIEEDGSIS